MCAQESVWLPGCPGQIPPCEWGMGSRGGGGPPTHLQDAAFPGPVLLRLALGVKAGGWAGWPLARTGVEGVWFGCED